MIRGQENLILSRSRRAVLIGDSDTSINAFHHASVIMRVVGGVAGNVLSSLTIGGVEILHQPVQWTTSNDATAALVATAIGNNPRQWTGVPGGTNFFLAVGPPGSGINGPSAGYWGQAGPRVRAVATGAFSINVFEGAGERGWWNWFQVLNGQYYNMVNNGAISGYRLRDNLVHLPDALRDSDAGVAIVHAAVNDVGYDGVPATTAFAAWKELIDETRKYVPSILSIGLPPGVPPVFSNAVNAAQLNKFNRLVSEYCRAANHDILFVPIGGDLVDGTNTAGNLLASMIGSDGIHLNTSAAYKVGKEIYTALSSLIPKNRLLYHNRVDEKGISASVLQKLAAGVGLFINTPASGVAGGWTAVPTTGTNLFSVVARTMNADGDTAGNNQLMDHTNSGGSADFTALSTASFHANLAKGESVYADAEIEYAITNGVGMRTIQLVVLVTCPPITHIMHAMGSWVNLIGSAGDLVPLPEGFAGTYRTPIIEDLSVAPTAATLQLQTWAHNAAGQSVVKIGRASVNGVEV